jgi:hypothetical protein
MSGKVYLDFEYNRSREFDLNPICVAFLWYNNGEQGQGQYWLQEEPSKLEFIDLVESWMAEGFTFIAFAVTAEARSLYSLGINPLYIKWVDLQIEWRMLTNHNNQLGTGKHLVKGKIVNIRARVPKWMREEGEKSGQVEHSLAACTYKMVGVDINTEHKDQMRDLILGKNSFGTSEREKILEYCMSDVVYLPEIHKRLYKELYITYDSEHRADINEEILTRGEYAAATAIMEAKGYPIDYDATKAFSDSTRSILFDMQTEIADQFDDVGPFLLDRKGTKYVQKKKNIQNWIRKQEGLADNWILTEKGDLSLKLEAFEKHFSSKNDSTVFGNRFVKYLRSKQSLNGFMPGGKSKTIWDFTGSDSRVRPYFGIFRAQSGRSQPSATSYIPLKSKWMRSLIMPPSGRAIVAIDYGQQEFLLAAILSEDHNMLKAYASGDPYFYTSKLAGAVPWDGLRIHYEEIREKFKSTALGIQYGMAAPGLSTKLTNDTGIYHSEEEAAELIRLISEAYPDYDDYKNRIWYEYNDRGYLRNPCGWTMFGDNPNRRSVGNFPIQGFGASIMRKAVTTAFKNDLEPIMTLHDAIYVECDDDEVERTLFTLSSCMDYAFKYYVPGYLVEHAECRQDPTVWGPDLDDGMHHVRGFGDVKFQSRYSESKTEAEYRKYRKYFISQDDFELLSYDDSIDAIFQ